MTLQAEFNKGTWLTANTELFTDDGWVNISKLHLINSLVIYDEEFKKTTVKSFSKVKYKGVVNLYKSNSIKITGKNIIVPNNQLWSYKNQEDILEIEPMLYEGYLYNIKTEHNKLITRCYVDRKNTYTQTICNGV